MFHVSDDVKSAIKEAELKRSAEISRVAGHILADSLKAAYSGRANNWHGVVKDSLGNVVYTCSHTHNNRDISSRANGRCALACAESFITEVKKMQYVAPKNWNDVPKWELISKK